MNKDIYTKNKLNKRKNVPLYIGIILNKKNMQIGDSIPNILGKDQNGNLLTAESLKGKKWILYFYPKDNTSGCTTQACNLRDNFEALQLKGYGVIGVSVDSAKSHQNFINKFQLPFSLITDEEKTLVQAFGVWGEKKMYGRTYMGTFRTTFLIDENGIVTHILNAKQIKVKEHADQILSL